MEMRIGITGHREISRKQEEKIRLYLKSYFDHYKKIYQDCKLIAVSSLAAGADTVFAEEAIDAGFELEIILPFSKIEYEHDFDTKGKEKLNKLFDGRKIIYATTRTITDENEKKEGYQEAGRKMVDICQIVIAAWNMKPSRGIGGTQEIMNYAWQQKKELHIIDLTNNEAQFYVNTTDEFRYFDNAATIHRSKYTMNWKLGILSACMATLFVITKIVFFHEQLLEENILEAMEIIAVGFAVYLLNRAQQKKNTQYFLRQVAETLRRLNAYNAAGISTLLANGNKPVSQPIDRDKLSEFIKEQTFYHEGIIEKYNDRNKNYKYVLRCILFLFIGCMLFNLVTGILRESDKLSRSNYESMFNIILFINLSLPSLYATLEGIRAFQNVTKNMEISDELVGKMRVVNNAISEYRDDKDIENAVKDLEGQLKNENSIWVSRMKAYHIEYKP